MPIYFGHPPASRKDKKTSPSPALQKLGINLLRAAPSQVPTFVLPYVESPLWGMFIASLSAIMFSLSIDAEASTNLRGYRITKRHRLALPIKYPNLCIEISNPGPSVNTWLVDHDFESVEIRGKQYYTLQQPTKEILEKLLSEDCIASFSDTNFVPYGYANMQAILAFSEMTNIISYLLQAMSAAMWAGSPNRSDLIHSNPLKGLISAMELDSEDTPQAESIPRDPKKTDTKDHAISGLFVDPISCTKVPNKFSGVKTTSIASNFPWNNINVLSGKFIGHGVFARFVPELCQDDQFGVINLFSKLLRSSLGNSSAEIVETIEMFRSSWGILKGTSAGHILSHIAKCIEIAVEGQCAITAMFDSGFYEGCLIQGLGFSISTRVGDFLPQNPDDISNELNAIESHGKILTLLQDIVTGDVDDVDIVGVKDMYSLRSLLIGQPIREENRIAIRKLAGKLRFPSKKYSVNVTSILFLLDCVAGAANNVDENTPLGPESLFSADPLELAMSCFVSGSCPGFRHPSGVPINLRSTNPPSPPKQLSRRDKSGPQQVNNGGWIFSVQRLSFEEAVSSFRLMIKEAEARSLSAASARGLGYLVLSGGNFERVFMQMKECLPLTNEGAGIERDVLHVPKDTHSAKRAFTGDAPTEAPKKVKRVII